MPFEWSVDRVCAVLVEAFRASPGLPVRSGWHRAPIASFGEVAVELNWHTRFVAGDPDGWYFLRTRAQCIAAGESIHARVRANGWSRARFERGWQRAAERITAGLNAERVNTAALLAGAAAEERLEQSGRIQVVVETPHYGAQTGERHRAR